MGEQRTEAHTPASGDAHRPRFGRARQEIVVAAVLLLGFVYLRLQLHVLIRGRRGAAYLDPDFWPSWLLNVGIVLALLYLVLSIVRERRGAPDPDVAPKPPADPTATGVDAPAEDHHHDVAMSGNPLALAVGFLLLFAYIWGMTRIGFVPATVAFAVAFLVFVGERRWYVITAFPVILLAGLLYVFTRLLVVPLPRGRGFFIELSTYFY
ncbi:tripartite tricarboxylate transporter TctB family protein [Egicoccus sp. AB-alg6-2]|uniref:tripartite tricarboxylate transporter TctB family protein n=1 Tax=Egicoccus sp. AB-alg6-2 TaxID=3242692 RepID=UPI00359D5EEC